MRKILYSPGYGAGWTTWNSGDVAKLMLTYKPIIKAIEAGERMNARHPAVKQLQADCLTKFGAEYICVLGASDLKVAETHGPVRITEYDGYESYVEQANDKEGWV